MAVNKLAPEIWLQIARYFNSPSHFAGPAAVSRKLYGIFQPELYRFAIENELPDITVLAAAWGNLATLKAAASFSADLNKPWRLPPPNWVREYWPEEAEHEEERPPPDACWGTPLHLASQHGHEDVVKWLVEQRVDIDAPGRFLCECRPMKHLSVVTMTNSLETLEACPAWTPLHQAICNDHANVARVLLSAGASRSLLRMPYPERDRGCEGFIMGQIDFKLDSAEQVPVAPTHIAAVAGHKSMLTTLVKDFGMDINAPDGANATPLHYAILGEDRSMVAHAVALGADPCRAGPTFLSNHNFRNALHWAVYLGDLEVVELFLKRSDLLWSPSLKNKSTLKESTLKLWLADVLGQRHGPWLLADYVRRTEEGIEGDYQFYVWDLIKNTVIYLPQLFRSTAETYYAAPGDKEPLREEIQATFLYFLLNGALQERDLNKFLNCRELDVEDDVDELLPRLLGSNLETDANNRFVRSLVDGGLSPHFSLGSLALCLLMNTWPFSSAEKTLEIARWLLYHGADPNPYWTPKLCPLGILFGFIEGRFWTLRDSEEPVTPREDREVRDTIPFIELLGREGAWPRDGPAVSTLRSAFLSAVHEVGRRRAPLGTELYRRTYATMPPETQELVEIDVREGKPHRMYWFTRIM